MPTATYLYWEHHCRATASTWICNGDGEIWAFHSLREDNLGGWQPVQGGIEQDEIDNPLRAHYREIWQEIGIQRSHLNFIAATNSFFTYKFPIPREGDKYEWITLSPAVFLVRDGVAPVFDKTDDPEFDASRWVLPEELLDICPPHKRIVFKNIMTAFHPVFGALRAQNIPAVPPLGQVVKAAARNATLREAMENGELVRKLPAFPGALVKQNRL